MFSVWQSVKVKNPDHPRAGTAGTVFATDPTKPDEVVVRFDLDSQREAVLIADLQAL